LADKRFDFQFVNPPYGYEWSKDFASTTRLKLYRSFYRQFSTRPTLSDLFQHPQSQSPAIRPTPSDQSEPGSLTFDKIQVYVNYFDRHVKLSEELPTIGIVLCHRKNDALVELTLPADANIFASKYQLYLPSKEELKAELEQITRNLEMECQP